MNIHHRLGRFYNYLESIPIQCLGAAIFFYFYHKSLIYWMKGINLGAVKFDRHVVPLYAEPQTNLSLWILPASIVLTGFLLICRKILLQQGTPFSRFFVISILSFLAIGISVAMIDGYQEIDEQHILAFLEPYTRTSLEYYGDVPKVDAVGLHSFLLDYAKPELFQTLSLHSQTHPPGGILFLWMVSKCFGYNLLAASLASICFTSLAVIPIYWLAKDLYGDMVGRYATVLFLIMPNFVMFTTTSMDGPFSVFPMVSVYLFYKAASTRSTVYAVLTGIALGFGMFMTFSTVFIGLYFGVVTLLTLMMDRKRRKGVLTVLFIAGAAFAGFYLLMFALTGFNLLEVLLAAIEKDKDVMGTGYESITRYFHVSIANLFAFLMGIGIPITIVWMKQIQGMFRRRDIYAIGYLVSLLVIAFSTLYTMEVERIWIFMAPFVVIPVAKHLRELCDQQQSVSPFYWVAGLLCFQLILFEATLYTYW